MQFQQPSNEEGATELQTSTPQKNNLEDLGINPSPQGVDSLPEKAKSEGIGYDRIPNFSAPHRQEQYDDRWQNKNNNYEKTSVDNAYNFENSWDWRNQNSGGYFNYFYKILNNNQAQVDGREIPI